MPKSCMHATSCGYVTTNSLSTFHYMSCSRSSTEGHVHSAGATHSVLNEAIFAYMNEVGEGHHDDIARAFFRYRAGDIGNLLPHVMEITRKSAYELGRSLSAALPETNRIVLVSLQR
jgi:nuclear pore complex protein Nup133